MTTVIYYDPPRLLDTPRGPAFCDFVVDYDMHQCFYYHCWVRETGECWTFANTEVRLRACETTKVRVEETSKNGAPPPSAQWPQESDLRAELTQIGAEKHLLQQRNDALRRNLEEMTQARDAALEASRVQGETLDILRMQARSLPPHSPLSTVRSLRAWGHEHPALGGAVEPVQGGAGPGATTLAAPLPSDPVQPPQPAAGGGQKGRGGARAEGRPVRRSRETHGPLR